MSNQLERKENVIFLWRNQTVGGIGFWTTSFSFDPPPVSKYLSLFQTPFPLLFICAQPVLITHVQRVGRVLSLPVFCYSFNHRDSLVLEPCINCLFSSCLQFHLVEVHRANCLPNTFVIFKPFIKLALIMSQTIHHNSCLYLPDFLTTYI